ncbi:MAG TPA: YCF48-related protein, partial [Candidatus Acidoferrum sp.]
RITELNVAPGDNVVDAKLQVGTATETVEVTAQSVTLNTESTNLASRQKDEKQLATAARNVFALKTLQSVAASSDGKNIWRFGEHGAITHSTDGGSTWQSQSAPVIATLTSGSAPSNKVCWIAGAAGTLLRTTDRGKHWQMVTTPITADLGGVQASDAKHAAIWDAANRMRYATSDGGATWRPVSNP